MKKPIDRSHETHIPTSKFEEMLSEITNRQLDARTIDTYADEALEDLVVLIQEAVDSQDVKDSGLSGIDKERQALQRVGLDRNVVEETLDHIAEVAGSTKRLDVLVMKKTKLVDVVMVPPDSSIKVELVSGDGSFEKPKERIQKLNTLLLLLEKGVDIDIESDEEVRIDQGVVGQNMMRSVGYSMVEISSLRRKVLVCDEVGNTTFVFDTDICEEYGISSSDIWELTKSDIKDLIDDTEGFGRKIDYSKDYVSELARALTEPILSTGKSSETDKITILKPKEVIDHVPDGYVTFADMCSQLNLSMHGLEARIAKADREEFGVIIKYRQQGMRTAVRLLSPSQQDLVGYQRFKLYKVELPQIPEDYVLFNRMAEDLGIHPTTLEYRIETLGEKFGEIQKVQRGARGVRVLSPDQQALLHRQDEGMKGISYGNEEGSLPVGSIMASEMAKQLQITMNGLTLRISKIDPILFGEKLYQNRRLLLTPNQQTLLTEQYKQVLDYIPDSYMTVRAFADNFSVSEAAILARIRHATKEDFGVVTQYREPGAKQSASYLLSPKQQEWIRKKYKEILDYIPDHYILYKDMCEELNISQSVLYARIKRFDDHRFGEMLKYRPAGSTGHWQNLLSSEQQKLLRDQDKTIKRRRGRAAVGSIKSDT